MLEEEQEKDSVHEKARNAVHNKGGFDFVSCTDTCLGFSVSVHKVHLLSFDLGTRTTTPVFIIAYNALVPSTNKHNSRTS
jgi:hypothetical protein